MVEPDLPGDELISLADAAKYSGLNAEFLRQLVVRDRLRAKRIARNWLTTRNAVDEYMANRQKRGRKNLKKSDL